MRTAGQPGVNRMFITVGLSWLSGEVFYCMKHMPDSRSQTGIRSDMTEEGAKTRILVVDDIKLIRDLIRSFYDEKAVELIEAVDGLEAVELARSCVPHLILLDIQMPRMNGYEAAAILKNDEVVKDIPILVITGMDIESVVEKMGGLCAGYLSKPFKKADLIAATRPYLPLMRDENGAAENEIT